MELDINSIEYELGEVLTLDLLCPDVWYASIRNDKHLADEYYIAGADAQCLSDYAKSLGKTFDGLPRLLFYNLEDIAGGRFIVKYEIQRYLKLNRLPPLENSSIMSTAMYGREHNPEYFGDYPAPLTTPRGMAIRTRKLMSGVYAVETETCETLAAVFCPIWEDSLSEYTRAHGERLTNREYYYLFFAHPADSLALFELRKSCKELAASEFINWPALMNAICKYYPDYAVLHNYREQSGLNDMFGLLLKSLGVDAELTVDKDNLIAISDGSETAYLRF